TPAASIAAHAAVLSLVQGLPHHVRGGLFRRPLLPAAPVRLSRRRKGHDQPRSLRDHGAQVVWPYAHGSRPGRAVWRSDGRYGARPAEDALAAGKTWPGGAGDRVSGLVQEAAG